MERECCTTNNISWVDIENEYVTDIRKKPCTLESLSEKYNIPIRTVRDYSTKRNWSKKEQNSSKVQAKKQQKKLLT